MVTQPGQTPPTDMPTDPRAVIRSRSYLQALVLAALLGVPIAVVAYGFLALVDWLQEYLFTELPGDLGFSSIPSWWPIPLLVLSGALVALCISYLPGTSGHSPAEGFKPGRAALPIELPGIVLAALATLALGAVLGPEAPLIALGGGLGALAVRLLKPDAPPSATAIIAGAGSFAAIATLIGSPLIAAFLLMEASAAAGAMMGVALLPGLLAAGVGALIFVGLNNITGLGTFSLALTDLPPFTTPTAGMVGWAIVFGLGCPLLAWGVRSIALSVRPYVHSHRMIVTPTLGLLIAVLAIAFASVTDKDTSDVLFSGQNALPQLVSQASTWSIGALVLLIVCKALAYALSLSAFRGGPIFPALFIGGAIGVIGSHLPGMSLVPALAIGLGAMTVSMLGLPFTSVMLATLLLSSDQAAVMPLAVVSVVVAHVVMQRLPEPRSLLVDSTRARQVGAVGAGGPAAPTS